MATQVENPATVNVKEETTAETDLELFRQLNSKVYKEQAVWILNAGWKALFENDGAAREGVWAAYNLAVSLDAKREAGNELDRLSSHRFLEKVDKALTVSELKETLSKIDVDHNKCMSLIEFAIYRYKMDWRAVVNAPQGQVDAARLELAEQKVNEAKEDIATSETRAVEARDAHKESVDAEALAKREAETSALRNKEAAASAEQARMTEELAVQSESKAVDEESEAVGSENAAKTAEAKASASLEEQRTVQASVEKALAEVKREEDAFRSKCEELRRISEDSNLGVVKRNKAKNELAQLGASDPQPLQKAIISHNAYVRKQERLTSAAAEVEAAASEARSKAEKSREQACLAREKASQEREQAAAAKAQSEQDKLAAEEALADALASKAAAEKARAHAEDFKQQSEDAVIKANASFQSACTFLDKVKKECQGAGAGKIWWMERELSEQKRFMSRAQIAKLDAARSQSAAA